MPLSPGTALQNGHYVIDALLDAAPNGDLHWGTHVISGTQVFIQIFRIAPTVSPTEVSALIARWQGAAFSPRSPLPNPFQLFHGDDQTLCLAMGRTIGLPWSSLCGTVPVDSPRHALIRIHTLVDAVTWLQKQGIDPIDLAPNRVWFTETGDRLSLTGLPYGHLAPLEGAGDLPISTPVQACARLLYSFLMGEWPASEEPSQIQQTLQQQLPSLSPRILQAICQGLTPPAEGDEPLSLAQWAAQLPPPPEATLSSPEAETPPVSSLSSLPPQQTAFPLSTPVATQIVSTHRHNPASPVAPMPRSRRFKKRYPALLLTAIVAAISGVGLGTVWRIQAKNLPGTLQLEPNQSFPAQVDWSGDTPEAAFEDPFFPAQGNPERPEESFFPIENPDLEEPLESPSAEEWVEEAPWEPLPEEVPMESPLPEEDIVEDSPEPPLPETEVAEPVPPESPLTPTEDSVPVAPPESEALPEIPSPAPQSDQKLVPETKDTP